MSRVVYDTYSFGHKQLETRAAYQHLLKHQATSIHSAD